MPLLKKSSKKAFEHNFKAELSAGKPKDQSLAIAYSVKRKAKKNMADGGKVGGSISANNERRPMPDNQYDDSKEISKNRGNKPSRNDSWTDNSTITQAQANDSRGKRLPIKRPKMVPTNAFSTRLYDKEGNLEESASPGPYGEQPESWENEKNANASGHPVRDMEDEHSTGRRPYAEGGKVNKLKQGAAEARKYNSQKSEKGVHTPRFPSPANKESMGESYAGYTAKSPADSEGNAGINARIKKPVSKSDMNEESKGEHRKVLEEGRKIEPKLKGLARGGEVESEDYDHPDNKYEHGRYNEPMRDDMPSEDEGASLADSRDEEDQDRQGPEISDMEEPHNQEEDKVYGYADGGEIGRSENDSEDQPDEAEEEHHNSIAAAIMARREKLHAEIDSGAHDMDMAVRMASGGIMGDDYVIRHEEGVNRPSGKAGQSHMGKSVRRGDTEGAKKVAYSTLREGRNVAGGPSHKPLEGLAEGGEILDDSDKDEILSHGSMDSDDSDQADLSRNHDEDANEEDQASFNALRKENYNSSNLDVENPNDSAQMGDSEEEDSENKHDMVGSIRRKMRMKRQFSQD